MSKPLSILDQGEFNHFTVTEHGIDFKPDTPREFWLEKVQSLCGMYEGTELARQRTLMLLADALNFGEEAYGEQFGQAIDNTRQALGLSPKTIANAQSVYKKIEASRRRDGITLGHYSIISALEPTEQDRYCDQILTHRYTISDLKEVVATDHPKTKRGVKRKTGIHFGEETEVTALQKAEDILEWIEANGVTEKWKIPLEMLYKVFRRKWASGRKR